MPPPIEHGASVTGDDSSAARTLSAARAERLLDQQLWCWGRDIERAEGNLLLEFGFARRAKPAGSDAASLYRFEPSPTSRVILRGFGVFYGDDRWGGLFLRRSEFRPLATPRADLRRPAWFVDDLPRLVTPRGRRIARCRLLLPRLLAWIGRYEDWVASYMGTEYRDGTLVDWEKRRGQAVPAAEIATAWRTLGADVAEHPARYLPRLIARGGSRSSRGKLSII